MKQFCQDTGKDILHYKYTFGTSTFELIEWIEFAKDSQEEKQEERNKMQEKKKESV